MATSVYTGGQKFAGAFKAGDLTMEIGGVSIAGAMVQNIQYQFNQQLNQFFELGSPSVFYVAGRAQGTLTINKLAAAKGLGLRITDFNDVCNPKDIGFSSKTQGCGGSSFLGGGLAGPAPPVGGDYAVNFKSCVLVGITGSADAQSVVITHGISLQFVDMEVPEDM
jgi:hypothetical protein